VRVHRLRDIVCAKFKELLLLTSVGRVSIVRVNFILSVYLNNIYLCIMMPKERNVFVEYRRCVLPDTVCNAFENCPQCVDAFLLQLSRNVSVPVVSDAWEVCLVDWSRMFRVYLN
jgi:hypothetical protein